MPLTAYPNGLSSFGIPLFGGGSGRTGQGSMFGNTWFVDATNGSDSFEGKTPDNAFATLTKVFTVIGINDTIFVNRGSYAGNFSTPLNSVAPFVSLIGMQPTDVGYGPFLSASVVTSPILDVRARGWRISGFEIDCPTTAQAFKLTTTGTSNANFLQIDNCLFTGGQGAIDWVGAPTFTRIANCTFDQMTASAMICSNSDTDVPRSCEIFNNIFHENINHINMNPRGFKFSVIRGNVFHLDGNNRDALVLLDNRGGGGCSIIDNYFDITKAQYTDDAATAFIRTSSSDMGAGNHCTDGEAADLISV